MITSYTWTFENSPARAEVVPLTALRCRCTPPSRRAAFRSTPNNIQYPIPTMLASPLLPIQPLFSTQHAQDDSLQYRPSRDKEAFNSLLSPPIEFVEGSSSGALAVPPGKYEPINVSPKAVKPNVSVAFHFSLLPQASFCSNLMSLHHPLQHP